jgi:hypothetical protein
MGTMHPHAALAAPRCALRLEIVMCETLQVRAIDRIYVRPTNVGSSASDFTSRSGEPGSRSRGWPYRLHQTTRIPKADAA